MTLLTWLTLVRYLNLVIMALTQIAVQYWVVQPKLMIAGLSTNLNGLSFLGLVLYTLLIAGAGNIINDILDAKIDLINKPQKMIIHRLISIEKAYWIYYLLNGMALLIALVLDVYLQKVYFIPIGLSVILLLYAYSKWFKQQLLIGNIVVALLCAFTPSIVWLAEQSAIQQFELIEPKLASEMTFLLTVYAFFAFLSTMYREIVKDVQDVAGDEAHGCKTLPIVAGIKIAKWVALLFGGALAIVLVIFMQPFLVNELYVKFGFLLLVVLLPLLLSFGYLWKAQQTKHFKQLSQSIKFIMLMGLSLLFLH